MTWHSVVIALACSLVWSGCSPRADGSTAWERFKDGYMSHPSMRGYAIQRQQREMQRQKREIERTIMQHHQAAQTVSLGETKSQVLAKLPDQATLGSRGKGREAMLANGKLIEVYYFRSGLTPNEEFTPYVFIDDRLVAIGWMAFNALDFPKAESP